jgi:hypothetical protein
MLCFNQKQSCEKVLLGSFLFVSEYNLVGVSPLTHKRHNFDVLKFDKCANNIALSHY